MQGNISENKLSEILGAPLEESKVIEARLQETYKIIRSTKRRVAQQRYIARRIITAIGGAAAIFVLMTAFCVMNPALASEIPVVGGFFAKLSNVFSFGKIPQEDTRILYHENEQNSGTQKGTESENNKFQRKSGDVTITLTEEYATNQAVFIGMRIENVNEFPRMTEYEDNTQSIEIETLEHYSFRPDTIQSWHSIEGRFENEHTFEGILRIDYSEINVDDRKYQEFIKTVDIKNNPMITDIDYEQYMEEYEIPQTFTMKLDITNVIGNLDEVLLPEGEELPDAYPNRYQNWWQEGSWSYDLTVTKKDSASRIIEVNETNDAGIGVRNIELSTVEMTINTIEGDDTFAVVLDADGNKIENGSSNAYELAIAGHDISKVYIYICDWEEYMNELKAYALPDNDTGRTFKEVLEERALFKTTVETNRQ